MRMEEQDQVLGVGGKKEALRASKEKQNRQPRKAGDGVETSRIYQRCGRGESPRTQRKGTLDEMPYSGKREL